MNVETLIGRQNSVHARTIEDRPMIDFLVDCHYPNIEHELMIARIRQAASIGQQHQDKFLLPCYTLSATFVNSRKLEFLKSTTGMIVIDIDKDGIENYLLSAQLVVPNYGLSDFINEILRDPSPTQKSEVALAGISVSGKGLFLGFNYSEPREIRSLEDKNLAVADHLAAFESIQWDFQNTYGISIDKSCKDLSRLRILTHDELIYFNPIAPNYSPLPGYNTIKRNEDMKNSFMFVKSYAYTGNSEGNKLDISQRKVIQMLNMIIKAPEGSRHLSTRKAAMLMGGLISGGVVHLGPEEGERILKEAVDARADWVDYRKTAYKAIQWGIEKGMTLPINYKQ